MSNDLEARLAKLTRDQLLALVQGMCRRSADRPVSFAAFAEEEVERFCDRVEAAEPQAAGLRGDPEADTLRPEYDLKTLVPAPPPGRRRRPDDPVRAALEEFVQNVESTGGVTEDADGFAAPQADPEWSDLGETYLKACAALGRPPVYDGDID